MKQKAKIRIMLVEDEAITALAMNLALENMGFTTTEPVATGRRALELLAVDRPDVVLMDINLTGEMDGIETACRIRRHSSVPIIFISGYCSGEVLARAQALGPSAIFVKPVRPEELREAIESAARKLCGTDRPH